MSDRIGELKPLDQVVDADGHMVQLVSQIDAERWIVFDYDIDDEVVWNVRRREVRVAGHE